MRPVPRFVLLIFGAGIFLCLLYAAGRNNYLREVMQDADPWKMSGSFTVGELAGYAFVALLSMAPAHITRSRPRASRVFLVLCMVAALPIFSAVIDWSNYTNWSHSSEDYLGFDILFSSIGFMAATIVAIVFRRDVSRSGVDNRS
jgi:hypothetical protein